MFKGKNSKEYFGYKVKGSSLTIPNLAPSLIELLANNATGDKLPIVGSQLFDDDESKGSIRVNMNQQTMDNIFNFGSNINEDEEVNEVMENSDANNSKTEVTTES